MRKYLLFPLLMLSSLASAQETPSAIAWLEKLSTAIKTLNFTTSYVVVKNNQAEPYHWAHAINEAGDEYELLSLLNGPRKDIIRKNNVVSYIETSVTPYSLSADHIEGPIPSIFSKTPSQLSVNYDLVLGGKSRILGRSAQLVRISAKDMYRYRYWLWLDHETALPLKIAMLSNKGQFLEVIQFTHLELAGNNPVISQLEQLELPEVVKLPTQTENNEFSWQPTWLPEGFSEVKSSRHLLSQTKQPVEFRMFSDGLVDVSIYMNNSDEGQRDIDYVHEGATIVYNQVKKGLEISVVGKVPVHTAKAIADGIVFTSL